MALTDSFAARDRIAGIRARFSTRFGESPSAESSLGASVATGFERVDATHFRAIVPAAAKALAAKPATVLLPSRASDAVTVEDEATKLQVSFALRGASDAQASVANGIVLYEKAFGGADVVHRVHSEGTEDYIVFDARPATEEIIYDVDVTHAAGLRLVESTLELLDREGSPRLRVAPPYVVDAHGQRSEGSLRVEGCAYDTSPAAPWGRAVTPPAARTCAVRVAWRAAAYPALVDPQWAASGALSTARGSAIQATQLASGKVLFAGGINTANTFLATAELYDPTTGTFAATGAMSGPRNGHKVALLPSGKVLIAGGTSAFGAYLASALLYDPVAGTFAATTGPMAAARTSHTATLLSTGKVLVAGGSNGATTFRTAELYDPAAGTFSATGSMIDTRSSYTATPLAAGGKVLVVGGFDVNGDILPKAELYNPATGTFAATGSMVTERQFHTTTLLSSGKLLVAGGTASGINIQATSEVYDPVAGTFAATGSMIGQRASHTATLLFNGKVVVTGGNSGGSPGQLSTVELYDPATGVFTASVPMGTPRTGHAATTLSAGKVLVAGGAVANAEVLSILPVAKSCTTNAQCDSAFCVDGVCCNSACTGQCQACDVKDRVGTCTPSAGKPRGARLACTGDGPCGATCDGTKTTECTLPAKGIACGATCASNTQTSSSCDGAGKCVVGTNVSCNNLICADATKCKTACVTKSDCLAGFSCDKGACVTGAVCIDDQTVQTADGPPQSCAPYKCAGGCKTKCDSVNDCVAPNVCNAGLCEPVTENSAGESDSGGGCNTSGSSGRTSAWLFGLLALLLLRTREKR